MKILVLGRGKTGAMVAEIARERGHEVRAVSSAENVGGKALQPEALTGTDVVIDFTTPQAALGNIEACASAGKGMVVGTTGWYDEIPQVKQTVERHGIGFVFGANFSVGVNLLFNLVKTAAAALNMGYTGTMTERHHVHKKDKPSGTAIALNNVLREASGKAVEIESVREGEIIGDHELRLESPHDTIVLSHSAKSRRGFAEGAVKAAEWVQNKKGFYDFRDIWQKMK